MDTGDLPVRAERFNSPFALGVAKGVRFAQIPPCKGDFQILPHRATLQTQINNRNQLTMHMDEAIPRIRV